jgi:hypothetical protein
MAMRSTAPKRKHQAFGLEEKIWLLDYATAKPKLNGNQLGQALAAHFYFSGKILHCVDEIALGCSSMAADNKTQASLKDLWGL